MKTMMDNGAATLKRSTTSDIVRVLLGAALILLVPLVAMQFTDEVAWSPFDFMAAGVLLVGTGLLYVLFTRKATTARQRIVTGLVLLAALLLVWMELAVCIFGTPFAGS